MSVFAILAVTAFVGAGVLVLGGGWQIRPILSGSMEPGFAVGGVVITQRIPVADLQLRDVAVFHPPGQPAIDYIHRVVSLRRTARGLVIQTAGDNNVYPDPWTLYATGKYAYVGRFTLPLLGYAAVWVHSPGGRRIILLAAGVLALILIASAFRDRQRQSTSSDSLPQPSQEAVSDDAVTGPGTASEQTPPEKPPEDIRGSDEAGSGRGSGSLHAP